MKYLITARENFKIVCYSTYKDFFISIYSKYMKENKDFLDFPKGGQNTLWSTKAESLHAVLRKSVILTEI